MKSLQLCLLRYCAVACCLMCFPPLAKAQTNADALMIPKNYFCADLLYNYDSWSTYWEGTYKRTNGNIGTVTTNMYSFMGDYGITKKLNVLFMVPYVTTKASAGTLAPQSGFQDFSLSVKWEPFQAPIGNGKFSFYAIGELSIPMTNYEPDFLPLSIGFHSESASIRALANYQVSWFFVSAAGQYTQRSDMTIDQDAYYTTEEIYSNRVDMPDNNNFLFSTGYRGPKFHAEAVFQQTTTLGGFDIRKNDMPFPSNTMNMTTVGALFKYSFSTVNGFELTAGGNYVVAGRNVGQSNNIFGGVAYLFNFSKK
jgi:hypothetical protein